MTALLKARRRIEARIRELDGRLDAGEDVWPAYLETLRTLTAVMAAETPGAGGRLLTTAELAGVMNCSPKKILRLRKAGRIQPAQQLGQRGRAALRWRMP
jgi:hypothetical protein